ncbi:hypothetical protein SAY86_001712 [Trapa natans]|uniref:Enhancer of rudimentary homolog n=1 Tax=Trapa natans TaxID=22666 RepID=A0AAN7LC03_TRANT|nr:hypothetical protein SAY86_001712 [Trapa natans]
MSQIRRPVLAGIFLLRMRLCSEDSGRLFLVSSFSLLSVLCVDSPNCELFSLLARLLLLLVMMNKHTIILMQPSHNRASRTFMDYESVTQAIDGMCGLYERKLKELNPAIRNITYDISDLYNFIDGLVDLSALVYNPSSEAYVPHDREWIKQRTYHHLKKMAA